MLHQALHVLTALLDHLSLLTNTNKTMCMDVLSKTIRTSLTTGYLYSQGGYRVKEKTLGGELMLKTLGERSCDRNPDA